MRRLALWVLMLAACSHGSGAPPVATPAPPTSPALACAKVGEHLIDSMPAAGTAPQEAKDKMAGALSQSCEDDHWTEDAKACLAAAHDTEAMKGCNDALTPAQLDGMNRRMMAAMGQGPGAPAARPSASPAATPSATPAD